MCKGYAMPDYIHLCLGISSRFRRHHELYLSFLCKEFSPEFINTIKFTVKKIKQDATELVLKHGCIFFEVAE